METKDYRRKRSFPKITVAELRLWFQSQSTLFIFFWNNFLPWKISNIPQNTEKCIINSHEFIIHYLSLSPRFNNFQHFDNFTSSNHPPPTVIFFFLFICSILKQTPDIKNFTQ